MNPQPSEAVGSIWAFIFILGVAFFAVKTYAECQGQCARKNLDMFTLGYIEESQQPQPVVITNNDHTQNTTNIVHQTSTKLSKLQLECIDTLIAIGYKKTIARKMVLEYFKNNEPSSVQEFIANIMKP